MGPSTHAVLGQPSILLTQGETSPAGGSSIPIYTANIIPIPGEGTNHIPAGLTCALQMQIILDCRDASTVPSVLDLLTLMNQDHPVPDQRYINTLSKFYEAEIEDVVEVLLHTTINKVKIR